jgi:hypothetical protein
MGNFTSCKISDFRNGVVEALALVGCYVALHAIILKALALVRCYVALHALIVKASDLQQYYMEHAT